MKQKRECGSCTMCCKLMGIVDAQLNKPANKWCEHCVIGVGCKIYSQHPESCKLFECMWLQDKHGVLSDDLRPDRIGVVAHGTINGGILVHSDPARPTAWRHPKLLAKLKALAAAGFPVSVTTGNRFWVITASTEWEATPDTVQRGPTGQVRVVVPEAVKAKIGLFIKKDIYPFLGDHLIF